MTSPPSKITISTKPIAAATTSTTRGFRVGDRVSLTKTGHRGRVAYEGKVKFRPGHFIGVVLERPVGLNNGVVKGVRYFECKPRYGIFVRAPALSLIEAAKSVKNSGSTSRTNRSGRMISSSRSTMSNGSSSSSSGGGSSSINKASAIDPLSKSGRVSIPVVKRRSSKPRANSAKSAKQIARIVSTVSSRAKTKLNKPSEKGGVRSSSRRKVVRSQASPRAGSSDSTRSHLHHRRNPLAASPSPRSRARPQQGQTAGFSRQQATHQSSSPYNNNIPKMACGKKTMTTTKIKKKGTSAEVEKKTKKRNDEDYDDGYDSNSSSSINVSMILISSLRAQIKDLKAQLAAATMTQSSSIPTTRSSSSSSSSSSSGGGNNSKKETKTIESVVPHSMVTTTTTKPQTEVLASVLEGKESSSALIGGGGVVVANENEKKDTNCKDDKMNEDGGGEELRSLRAKLIKAESELRGSSHRVEVLQRKNDAAQAEIKKMAEEIGSLRKSLMSSTGIPASEEMRKEEAAKQHRQGTEGGGEEGKEELGYSSAANVSSSATNVQQEAAVDREVVALLKGKVASQEKKIKRLIDSAEEHASLMRKELSDKIVKLQKSTAVCERLLSQVSEGKKKMSKLMHQNKRLRLKGAGRQSQQHGKMALAQFKRLDGKIKDLEYHLHYGATEKDTRIEKLMEEKDNLELSLKAESTRRQSYQEKIFELQSKLEMAKARAADSWLFSGEMELEVGVT